MTVRQITTILLILASLSSIGQPKKHFQYLTKISLDTTYQVFFAYDAKFTTIINKPCYTLDRTHPLSCSEDSVLEVWTIVAKYKNKELKDSLTITYSAGLSADPEFVIFSKSGEIIERFSCLEFYINGSGTIYTSGHTNSMYNRRRKFQIKNDTIDEIIQPFNYVGLKGKTLKAITLYKNKTGSEIIAQLPQNYFIEILLADGKTKDYAIDYNFLVRTDFGLVGWLRLEREEAFGEVLKNLYFAGD
ncbi:hypothetical protein EYV94_06135 [Puteibacter caeruleilacunae]|nr:hypothetical protein EYV94_06135 [Puteibacter caeruleilacunae]